MIGVMCCTSMLRTVFSHVRVSLRLLREPRVPLLLKTLPVLAAAYVVSPLDLVPDVLPMSEGSAPDVQAGQSNVEPVREQRPVGEVLGEAPVDGVINIARNQPPVLQHFLDVGV